MILQKPISARTLEHSEKKIDNGTESIMATEMIGANGVKYICDGLVRSTETDEKINRVTTIRTRKFHSKDDKEPATTEMMTILEDITKGELEGDYRWDTVEYTFVTTEGVQKFPPHRNKRLLANRNSGSSEQEVTEKIFTHLGLK